MSATQLPKKMTQTTIETGRRPWRTPLTRQAGQVLLIFGMLFKHVPPFNETIHESTGDTLISISRKLLSE